MADKQTPRHDIFSKPLPELLDDLAAGVYANIAAHLVLWLAGKI